MKQATATILPLPDNAKARNERRLEALWAEEDRLVAALKAHRARIVPVQREVSLGRGYGFTVSREKLELSMKRGR